MSSEWEQSGSRVGAFKDTLVALEGAMLLTHVGDGGGGGRGCAAADVQTAMQI